MALNGSYVDVDFILDKLDQDYGFDDIEYNDVVEDIWDIIGYVSDPSTFERKFVNIAVEDYRGTMPADFYSIVDGTVMELDTYIPLLESSDVLDRFTDDTTMLADTDALEYSYRIIKGYIYTGLETSTLVMSYRAFPTENSLPMVPDHPKVIRAVVEYLGERIAFKLMLKDKLSERKYEIIQQKSLFSTAAYKTSSKIPSMDKMERIKNMHLNILRNPNMHDNQFKYLGTRARVYTQAINTDGESNLWTMTLTATSGSQTTFARTSEISAENLDTVKEAGVWVATLSGTAYTLTYGTDVSYSSTTDNITYVDTNFGAMSISDTIYFSYNVQ